MVVDAELGGCWAGAACCVWAAEEEAGAVLGCWGLLVVDWWNCSWGWGWGWWEAAVTVVVLAVVVMGLGTDCWLWLMVGAMGSAMLSAAILYPPLSSRVLLSAWPGCGRSIGMGGRGWWAVRVGGWGWMDETKPCPQVPPRDGWQAGGGRGFCYNRCVVATSSLALFIPPVACLSLPSPSPSLHSNRCQPPLLMMLMLLLVVSVSMRISVSSSGA